jgi:citrate lyase alpha subunit
LRHCGLGDEALKHQVKNLQDVLDRLAEKRLDEDRKSNRPQFESLKAEDKVFAMLMAALEMQGVRKGVEIALRHWHPGLKQDDVLCKQVLEEAFQLPVIDETPGVPKATR